MLLLTSKLILSQSINIYQLNNVEDIYKGLKQTEYLKYRLKETNILLDNSLRLNQEYDKTINLKDSYILKQDTLILNLKKELELKRDIIKNQEYIYNEKIDMLKKEQKQKFLKGTITGLVVSTIISLTLISLK